MFNPRRSIQLEIRNGGSEADDSDRENDEGMETVSFSVSESSASDNDDPSSSSSSDSSDDNHEDDGLIPMEAVIDVSDVPNSVQQARRKLSMISARTSWNPRGLNFVWQVLQKFPVLAASTFEDPYDELKYPLALLLRAKARREVIESVYEMFPKAISRPNGSHGDTLLHDACWYGAPTDVIRFIAMEYPDALTKTNDYRRLPVHDAVRSYSMGNYSASASDKTHPATIRMLIDMYPDCMKIKDNDGKLLLESAFSFGYDLELLEWMTTRWPDLDTLNCSSPASIPLDQPRTELVARVLPHLKFLRCDPHSWTSDGFIFLMDRLALVKSLEVLELLAFPGQLVVDSQEVQRAFQNFIEQTNLSTLVVVFPRLENLLENFCDICLCRDIL